MPFLDWVNKAQDLPVELAGVLKLRPTSSGASALVHRQISEAVEASLLQGCTSKRQVVAA